MRWWSGSHEATCRPWTLPRTIATEWRPGSPSRRRSPASRSFPPERLESFERWDEDTGDDDGWGRYNRYSWLRDYPGFVDFFFDQLVPETHSTKLIEDLVGWSARHRRRHAGPRRGRTPTRAEVGVGAVRGGALPGRRRARQRRPSHPPRARSATGGADRRDAGDVRGHRPRAAGPAAGGAQPGARRRAHRRDGAATDRPIGSMRLTRPKRVLYLSSPIGLGHVRRDLAIADELRKQHPGLEIDWLSQSPVTDFLERAGERVHPASAWLASESGHIESESGEHDLHAFQAIRRMDEILVANFMVFDDLVRERDYDLWIGDEAWDLDHFLHENPGLKRAPFAWLTDFVGWLPMADGGEREAYLTVGLQRRDGRARRALPAAARPVGLRRRSRGPRGRPAGPGAAVDPRLDDGALRLQRLRDGRAGPTRPTGRGCAGGWGTPTTRWSASPASAAPAWAAPCCGASSRRTTRPRHASRACGWRWSPAPGSTRRRSGAARGPRARVPARPRPAPRRVRRGDRAGRAVHHHGAHRQPAAVPLLPPASPLRAAGATSATGSSGTARAAASTTRRPGRT